MFTEVKSRLILTLSLVLLAIFCVAPTILVSFNGPTELPNWLPRPLTLGLDLKGGGHLVYEVMADEAVKSKLQSLGQSIRADLRAEKIAVKRTSATEKGQIELLLLSERLVERAKTRIAENFKSLVFVEQKIDNGQAALVYSISDLEVEETKKQAVSQAVETLRNRIDQFGVTEPIIQRVGVNRIQLQMPGVSDIESIKRVIGSVAKLEFRLLPASPTAASGTKLKYRDGSSVQVEDEVLMTGDAVSTARAGFFNNQIEVSLTFGAEGTQTFRRITTENVGRQLAIILDNVVYSAPSINEPITGGMASISGGFTLEEARQLAVVLRAGALPAPLTVLEERTVGPTLGKESIQAGNKAIAVGFLSITLFLLFFYKKSGVIATVALLLNLLLLVACLALFGATLTLPGLAGLALTAGMAVDSNVIIFERIKDELRNGANRDSAVRAGFDRAWSAILDGNLTTLIAAAVLFWLGSGPIRGFAVSLAVGILTTIFSAIFITRLAFDLFKLKSAKAELSI
jgi:preprotein translocase subunit SecD